MTDKFAPRDNEILRTVVGSEVTGTSVGTQDHDLMGIYVETKEQVYGLSGSADTLSIRTQPEGQRSQEGDTDLTLYSLRKYLHLAAEKGNPSVLLPLWAPENMILVNTEVGQQLRDLREAFLSQKAIRQFLGYMQAQHERMMGSGKRNRVPKRPELEEQFGYDTKYAGHSLRLAMQGYELVSTRNLSLPMPRIQRETILEVRNGLWTKEQVSDRVSWYERAVQGYLEKTALPERADHAKLSKFCIEAHETVWSSK